MCARWVRFFRNGGANPLIARLRQHVVPPQPPQLFSIRVQGSPPKPPSRGAFLLSASFRRSTHKQPHNQALLIWMGVGLWVLAACAGCSTKSKGFQQTTWPSRPLSAKTGRAGQGRAGRAGQGRAGQGRAGRAGRAGQEGSRAGPGGQRPNTDQKHANHRGVWGSSLLPDGKEVIRGAASLQSSYTGRLYPPSPF